MALSWQQGGTRGRTWPASQALCRADPAHARRMFFHDLTGKLLLHCPSTAPTARAQQPPQFHTSKGHRQEALQWWLVGQLLAGREPLHG